MATPPISAFLAIPAFLAFHAIHSSVFNSASAYE
jgi:hypothetical protein